MFTELEIFHIIRDFQTNLNLNFMSGHYVFRGVGML